MEIKPKVSVVQPPAVTPASTSAPQKAKSETPEVSFEVTGAAKRDTPAASEALTRLATNAVTEAMTAGPQHPVLEKFGESVGLALGVIVTEALALAPKWNKPLLDEAGKPVASVPGAERVGDHDIRKRHEEVVGPKVAALVAKLEPGVVHDLLDGLAKGATEAPGASYRLEAKVSDLPK